MHSKIFQITRTRVYQDNYLNEGTLTQGDDSFFDYCAEIDDKERKHHIGVLVNHILPEGMFELVSEDVPSCAVLDASGEMTLKMLER